MNSLDFDRRTLGLLAAVLVGAIGLTLFVTGRGRAPQAAPVAPAVVISATPAASASAIASSSPTGEVVVEVVGKVARPAVVTLPKGLGCRTLLEAVGGAKPGVDTSDQNLARVLVDGEQIRIGMDPAPDAAPTSASGPSRAARDRSTSTPRRWRCCRRSPGWGRCSPQRIVTYREQNGGFQNGRATAGGIGDRRSDIRTDEAAGDRRRWWLTGVLACLWAGICLGVAAHAWALMPGSRAGGAGPALVGTAAGCWPWSPASSSRPCIAAACTHRRRCRKGGAMT